MLVNPSVITHSSSSLAPQNQNMETTTEATMDNSPWTLEELFYLYSYPCTGYGDQEWCSRATIKAIAKADTEQNFTYAEIKEFVERQYGLI